MIPDQHRHLREAQKDRARSCRASGRCFASSSRRRREFETHLFLKGMGLFGVEGCHNTTGSSLRRMEGGNMVVLSAFLVFCRARFDSGSAPLVLSHDVHQRFAIGM